MIREDQIFAMGDNLLLISWPDEISEAITQTITSYIAPLEKILGEYVYEIYHTYSAIGIHYNPAVIGHKDLIDKILKTDPILSKTATSKIWNLPVCYEGEHAPDMDHLSKITNLKPAEIIKLHTAEPYHVHFFGFLPGFMYLGGLNKALHAPRKSAPSREVPEGAVAIGGAQTGIYPGVSPGAWYIIGQCPAPLFDAQNDPPCFITPGDLIQFIPVSITEHQLIKIQIETNIYDIPCKQVN